MKHAFATATKTLLSPKAARVFFDGIFTQPKLSHPECVVIGPDGWIWAGSDAGDIFRIAPDGAKHEVAYRLGGFALGMAFDSDRALFVCDLQRSCLHRVDLATGTVTQWGHPDLRIPNYPVIDRAHGRLFVSDSHSAEQAGPGIFAFDLSSGESNLWFGEDMVFANGLAMRTGEQALYVAETFARCVSRIPILNHGQPGRVEDFASNLPGLPDGIAFDSAGNLIVACYEPSRLLRIPAQGGDADVLIEDPTAHTLCHPTNIAFFDDRLFAANLGRWHVTEVTIDIATPPLVRVTQ